MIFSREELLTSPEYWFEGEQNELYRQVLTYLKSEKINKTELAKRLQVSKSRVSQILDGEYNYSLKKLIEICLAIGIVPKVKYTPIQEVLKEDAERKTQFEITAPISKRVSLIGTDLVIPIVKMEVIKGNKFREQSDPLYKQLA